MSELRDSLKAMAEGVGGVRAAVVLETSGIEVASWGDADFEIVGAELSEIWKSIVSAEFLAESAGVEGVEIRLRDGSWIVHPLGAEYVLALRSGPTAPTGKVRFHASQWTVEHRGDFS